VAVTDTLPLAVPDVEEVRRDARAAPDAVTAAARRLDDPTAPGGLAGPSALPGWSRSHVLAHVTAIGEAMARQAEVAARGGLAEVYDGGAAGREAGIQAGARRSVAEHVAALEALAGRLDAAWPAAGSPDWAARVTYRDGTVVDALVAWWREVRVHAVDLDAGIGLASWTPGLGHHLLDFLGVRLADDVTVELAGEPDRLVVGPGGLRRPDAPGVVVVRGALVDVAAWLAGRSPGTDPVALRAGEPVALPPIGPWPSPYSRPAADARA